MVQQLIADFRSQAAYVEPEILRMGGETVDRFLSQEPRLDIYAFHLRDTARRGAHTLSDAEEKILADTGPLASSPANIFGILANADFPYPTITLSNGSAARVDQAESVRSTVFRQTQLAEFELAMHRMAERGEAITGEAVAACYLEIAAEILRP